MYPLSIAIFWVVISNDQDEYRPCGKIQTYDYSAIIWLYS